MFKRIRQFYSSLAVKITITICCIIIPIILLILIISNLMIKNLQEKFVNSYSNELVLYMTQLDADLFGIKKDIKYILSENWTDFAMNNIESSSIVKYKFWKNLKAYRSQLDFVDVAYLKTNWDNDTLITYNNITVPYKRSREIQKFLNNTELSGFQNLTYKIVGIEDNNYLIINENSYNFSYGFIININTIIDPLQKVKTFESEQNYIADINGNILTSDVPISVDPSRGIQSISEQNEKVLMVSCPSEQMDYMLVRTVSMKDWNSIIPFLEKVLRFVAFLSILIIPLMWLVIRKLVLIPLHRLGVAMHEIEMDNLDYRIESKEKTKDFQHMNHMFNRMTEQINQLTIETYEKDIEKLQIEATNMRLQVNPHMLLNSLNMIYSLSQSQNYKCIQEFTLCLTDYFRYVLHCNNELVTVEEEMKFVNSFLGIQKIRFPGSFVSVCNINEKLFKEKIPPLLIQNFVENSIKYALKMGSEIEIIIIVKRIEDKLVIAIVDTGYGIEQDILDTLRRGEVIENKSGKHIGIWNCRRRLKMYYGDEARLNISSAINEGTQVWIEIPLVRSEDITDESINC